MIDRARRQRRRPGAVLVATVALVAAACGQTSKADTSAGTTARPPTSTTLAVSTSTTKPPTTTTSAPTTTTTAIPSSTTTAVPPPTTPATPAPRLIDQIADTGGAAKVMTVDSPSWSSATATMILWQHEATGWVQVAGPWFAWTGGGGWSYKPGESTRRSPAGSFTFGTGFGLKANPGYRLGWFVVHPTDYWVEDPSSRVYNTHQPGPTDDSKAPWGHFERLIDQPVAYQYSALINFNVPVSGSARGSGIFLHVSKGASTAGCVSLPVDELLTALRWIDGNTRIVMGPDSVIRTLRPGT